MGDLFNDYQKARWVPWLVFAICLSATVWIWQQLAVQEARNIETSVSAEVKAVEHELGTWVHAQVHFLKRIAASFEHHPADSRDRLKRDFWKEDIHFQMELFRGLEAVLWVDDKQETEWITTRPSATLNQELIKELIANPQLTAAVNQHRFTATKVPLCEQQRSRFVVNVPIADGGAIVGVFLIDQLLTTVLTNNAPHLIVQVRDGSMPVFQNVPGELGTRHRVEHSLKVFNNSWTLAACPTESFLKREHTQAVELTLVVGAGVSWLLALIVGLAIRTHVDKIALEEHKNELAHFSSIVANCQDAIISTTKDGTIISWNASAELLFGYRAADVIGEHVSILDVPSRDPNEDVLFQKVCNGHWVDPFDTVRARKNGEHVHISLNESPITDSNGKIVGVSNISRDITDRIRVQNQLAHFSSIVHSCQDAIISTTKTGEILSWNESAELLFGYTSEEVIGKNISILDPPDRDPREEELFRKVCHGRWVDPFDTKRRHKDGTILDVSLNESPISCGEKIVGVSNISRDITYRKRVETQLEENAELLRKANESLNESYEQAEAATRAKSEFLANMSHEIRTPMTAILGFADLLADRPELDNAMVDAVGTIKRNGEYLLQLINDILDLSKIEADKMEVEQIVTQPTQIIGDVEKLMRVRAQTHELELVVNYRSKIPETIVSDPIRLKQILVNLLGNAIKFTPHGRVEIAVEFRRMTHELTIEIIDEGIGMSKEQLSRLFKPFTQADTTTTRRFGGTGLGLTISQRLTQLLGGKIEVESELDHGSLFRVVLSLNEEEYGPLVSAVEADPEAGVSKVPATPRLDCKILLAEDGKDNQRLIAFLLQKAGARVDIAEDGRAAVDKAMGSIHSRRKGDPTEPYDVILMDMQMPIMDGYEATRRLREFGYDAPIIALTANAMTGDREKCLAAGCTDYMAKPINRDALISLIAEETCQATTAG